MRLIVAEAEALPTPDDYFDSATIGFALRNVTDIDRTFAEMAPDEKHAISHRGRAFRALAELLEKEG